MRQAIVLLAVMVSGAFAQATDQTAAPANTASVQNANAFSGAGGTSPDATGVSNVNAGTSGASNDGYGTTGTSSSGPASSWSGTWLAGGIVVLVLVIAGAAVSYRTEPPAHA